MTQERGGAREQRSGRSRHPGEVLSSSVGFSDTVRRRTQGCLCLLQGGQGQLGSGSPAALSEARSMCLSLPCWPWRGRMSPESTPVLCFPDSA